MARPNENNEKGWDFLEVGKIYQYKEDGYVFMVLILEDNSNETQYEFKLKPVAGTIEMKEFTVSHLKKSGYYNGMSQFYKETEYILAPIGTPWPWCLEEKYEFVGLIKELKPKA